MTEQARENMETPTYTLMTADVYDAIYAGKDYAGEAQALKGFINRYKQSDGNELLEVACGSGLYLPHLADDFEVSGVDLSEQQVVAARKRMPGADIRQGDMRDFDLGRQFDAVVCLFSSIGYVHPYPEMQKAVANMAKHLKPGGVMIIEPWLQPGAFDPERPPHVQTGELPSKQLKVTRTATNGIDGNISILNLHHLVESPAGTQEFTEEHRLALYTEDEFQEAFASAGLSFNQNGQGISGRGIYIGVKPKYEVD